MRSLARTLSWRLACTLFATLVVVGGWTLVGVRGALERQLGSSPVVDETMQVVVLRFVVGAVVGAVVTWVGAGWFADSAMRPVQRIAEEARGITGTAGGHRITTHADVAEFTGLIQVLNDMLARLERVRAWHQRIIRDLGHDLRTPITAMRTGTEVALWSERTPEEYRRVLHSTLEETERLAVISDALMLLGRLESGDLQPQLTRMDVRSEVRDVIERARQRSADHRFEVVCSSTIVEVEADPVLLGMVLDQLLDNAVRYTPAGTRIRVSAMLADGAAQVVVEDNGPGVPAAKLPHLFEPFYRADEARGRNGGPGLGLTVARSIVELHDGTVAAERGAESGLLIRIRLPVSSGHGAGVLA